VVDRFVAVFNVGDRRALQQLWAQSGQGWDWYSTDAPGERVDKVARDRAGLGDYFSRRHVSGERVSILSFGFNGTNGALGDFQFTLTRAADDMPPAAYVGKGSAVCSPAPLTIGTWSMARDPQGR